MSQKILFLLGGLVLGAAAVLAANVLFTEDLYPLLKRERARGNHQAQKIRTLMEERERLSTSLEQQREEAASSHAAAQTEIAALREKVRNAEATAAAAAAAHPAEEIAPEPAGVPTKERS